jgi:hypothetical protein
MHRLVAFDRFGMHPLPIGILGSPRSAS